jgi:hypothetical protein
MKVDMTRKDALPLLARQQQVIQAVLTATTRISPGELRGEGGDDMSDVLAEVERQKALIRDLD